MEESPRSGRQRFITSNPQLLRCHTLRALCLISVCHPGVPLRSTPGFMLSPATRALMTASPTRAEYYLDPDVARLATFSLPLRGDLASLHRSDALNYDTRDGGNYVAFIRVIGCEGHKHELRTVRQFDIGGIMARCAGPAGFRPKARAFDPAERYAGKPMPLIIVVAALAGIVAFEQFHHLPAAFRGNGPARDNLTQQARRCVRG